MQSTVIGYTQQLQQCTTINPVAMSEPAASQLLPELAPLVRPRFLSVYHSQPLRKRQLKPQRCRAGTGAAEAALCSTQCQAEHLQLQPAQCCKAAAVPNATLMLDSLLCRQAAAISIQHLQSQILLAATSECHSGQHNLLWPLAQHRSQVRQGPVQGCSQGRRQSRK